MSDTILDEFDPDAPLNREGKVSAKRLRHMAKLRRDHHLNQGKLSTRQAKSLASRKVKITLAIKA